MNQVKRVLKHLLLNVTVISTWGAAQAATANVGHNENGLVTFLFTMLNSSLIRYLSKD